MSQNESFEDIELDQWVATASRHRAEGFRLVQMTGTAREDHFEVMISYDKNYECVNFRVHVPRDQPELPSLSGVFAASFTYENELKDLFGFNIPGLALDYGGNFLRTKTKIPFSGSVTLKKDKPQRASSRADAGAKVAPPTPVREG
ncbi:Fe-S-binding domain-containing protein [Thiocystis minor]|uniref:NADH-quinone oxidoreductase subunit C n=1 Tax=Thiocystis minor TaxID=61597 RepID=UPI0019131D06|nr:NADH-quinone oxidoreductase subunit C [Thiocystis minor]MBK5963223.1 Fe-S-binding domain-containing protein [Thiocystis minor]